MGEIVEGELSAGERGQAVERGDESGPHADFDVHRNAFADIDISLGQIQLYESGAVRGHANAAGARSGGRPRRPGVAGWGRGPGTVIGVPRETQSVQMR